MQHIRCMNSRRDGMTFDESPLPGRRRSVANNDMEFCALAMGRIESRPLSSPIADAPFARTAAAKHDLKSTNIVHLGSSLSAFKYDTQSGHLDPGTQINDAMREQHRRNNSAECRFVLESACRCGAFTCGFVGRTHASCRNCAPWRQPRMIKTPTVTIAPVFWAIKCGDRKAVAATVMRFSIQM